MLIAILSFAAGIGKILGIFGLIFLLPGIGIGAYYFVKSSEEKDKKKKKMTEIKGIWWVVLPFALIVGSLLLHLTTKFLIKVLS